MWAYKIWHIGLITYMLKYNIWLKQDYEPTLDLLTFRFIFYVLMMISSCSITLIYMIKNDPCWPKMKQMLKNKMKRVKQQDRIQQRDPSKKYIEWRVDPREGQPYTKEHWKQQNEALQAI